MQTSNNINRSHQKGWHMLTIRKSTTTTIKKMIPGADRDPIDHNHELLNIQLKMAMSLRINTAVKSTIIMVTAQRSMEAILTMTTMTMVGCGNVLVRLSFSVHSRHL
jgi:hypothetical protein